MLVVGGSKNVRFATATLEGSSGEDRFAASLHTLQQSSRSFDPVDDDFLAFGVFDGHGGVNVLSFHSEYVHHDFMLNLVCRKKPPMDALNAYFPSSEAFTNP